MSRIFVLEDMSTRIDAFKKRYINDTLTIAVTAQEAIDILVKDLNWDLISLDHDLGQQIFCSSDLENSGYRVAKFLSDKDIKGQIIIHSWNPAGARKMMEILPKAIYKPFGITR